MTYNACGTIKWNNGVSYPIQSGHMVVSVAVRENFWDDGPFYERLTGLPGFGIENNADQVGKVAAGMLAGGIAIHALASNVSKHKELKNRIDRGKSEFRKPRLIKQKICQKQNSS
ncbi:MAG: hypothetical protein MZV63_33285 [Marinilabiliales bacterium]|nr:hypothetical protein [Marinilabiliales bacterium]